MAVCERVTIDTPEGSVPANLYLPERDGRFPPIVFMHEIFGPLEYVQRYAAKLADEGFLVVAPELFRGALGCVAYVMGEIARGIAFNKATKGVRIVRACMDWAKKHPRAEGARVGVFGMCLTGGYVLHLAVDDDSVPALFHHSFGYRGAGADPDVLDRIRGPVLGVFAENDPRLCPPRRSNALRAALGERLEYHRIPNTTHGILFGDKKKPEGAAEAWSHLVSFFQRQMMEERKVT
jgi:carboxymethylenebutenolidase